MKKTLQNIIFAVFLVAGIVCSLTMLTARVCAEERCASAAFAIELKSVQRLAAADGRSAEDWLSDLSAAGVGYLIGTDETETEAKALCARFGMAFARSGNAAKAGDAFLLPPTGEGKEIAAFSAAEFDSAVPIALVENLSRTGVLMPESFSPEAWPGPMVKTMYMYEKYSVCDEFGSAAENENILFRGVMDRGLRLVILTPLELSDGALNTDPTVYQTMLHSLGVRLQTRGIQTAETFSALDAPQRSAPLLFGAALSGLLSLVQSFLPLSGMVLRNGTVYFDISPLLLVLLTCAAYGVLYLFDRLFQKREPDVLFSTVHLTHSGKSVQLSSKIDTGMTLREPFSGLPVILVHRSAVKDLLPPNFGTADCPLPFRLIPFSSVGGTGVLPAFSPDAVTVNGRPVRCWAAVCEKPLSAGVYDALISADLAPNTLKEDTL